MATNSKTTTKTAKPMVQMTQKATGVYAEAQEELKRSNDLLAAAEVIQDPATLEAMAGDYREQLDGSFVVVGDRVALDPAHRAVVGE